MEDSFVMHLLNRKFKDIYLCFCGYAKCEPLHGFGPAVRPDYLLHFVLEGKGSYSVDGREYFLHEGQGFLVEPDIQTYYQADLNEPWSYLWVGIGGELVKDYLNDAGINHNHLIFQSSHGAELRGLVKQMLQHSKPTAANEFLLQGLLFQFLSLLIEDSNPVDNSERNGNNEKSNLYIRKAVEFIRDNYADGIKVADVADYVSINRSYLYMLFQETMGISPQDYLTNFRVTRAGELLQYTDLSVEGVSISCGYHDPLVFSKAFKGKTGLSPSQYRKNNRKKLKEDIEKGQDELGNL